MSLLGMLFLSCMFAGPAAARTQGGLVPAVTASGARGLTPLGIGQREARDHLRALPRGSTPAQSLLAVALERPTTAVQDSTLLVALLGGAALFAPLVAGFRAVCRRTVQVARRALRTRRDRAPPAVAFA